jgi:hypothetical protein
VDVTQEQRTWARVAGITILLKTVLELSGDAVTIISRTGASFEDTAHWAAQSDVLYRFALLNVGVAWILLSIMAFALYVVLEPVNKRLAQLALILRFGASFVGAASLMFRFAQGWLYKASEPAGLLPQLTNALKLIGLPGLIAEIVTAFWLLFKGLRPRAATEKVRA